MPFIQSNAFHPPLAGSRIKYTTQEKSGRAAACVACLDKGTRRAAWSWAALGSGCPSPQGFALPIQTPKSSILMICLSFFLGHTRKDTLRGNATYA